MSPLKYFNFLMKSTAILGSKLSFYIRYQSINGINNNAYRKTDGKYYYKSYHKKRIQVSNY